MNKFTKPIWQKNFAQAYKSNSIIALCGNVNDKYVSCDSDGYSGILDWLYDFCQKSGYENVEFFSPAKDFFDIHSEEIKLIDTGSGRHKKRPIEILADKVTKDCIKKDSLSSVWVVEDASFLNGDRYHPTPEENDAWVKLRISLNLCRNNNKLILLFNDAADVPGSLRASPDFLSQIVVTKPTQPERKEFVHYVLDYLLEDEVESVANAADSLTIARLEKVVKNACKNTRNPSKANIINEINLEIIGYSDNPWKTFSKEKVSALKELLKAEIKGQDYAIDITSKKVGSACLGITDVVYGPHSPKGTLTLAGPTGVGKTELAKQVASILFGDENAMIRIDANEYREAHTAQRLVGSPPGYIGHEAGGQLTNAILEKPFSVILIDEIEKANPTIWDYFMTIIQDGRLTDGRGILCDFSNAFIFFTTNLGAKESSSCDTNEEASQIVRSSIESYFLDINRKETYGRIKSGIIPFNKVDDTVAKEIVEKQLNKIIANAKEKEYSIQFSDKFIGFVMDKAGFGSEYGGRDITNKVNSIIEDAFEEIYLNHNITADCQIFINDIIENNDGEIVNVDYSFIEGTTVSTESNEDIVSKIDVIKPIYSQETVLTTDTSSPINETTNNSSWTYIPRRPRN